jgi:peptide deformylase
MSKKVTAPRDLIISLPNPALRQTSQRVGLITPEITELITNMKAATLDWEDHREHEVGVALAAVQIGILQRVVIVRSDIDNREDRRFHVFINPEITKKEGELVTDLEGCLSVPGMYGQVPRYNKVRVKALDENGKEFRVTAEGFLARVFQHEIDHTKGKVYIDYIKDNAEAFFKLDTDGKIKPLDYDKDIANNNLLW